MLSGFLQARQGNYESNATNARTSPSPTETLLLLHHHNCSIGLLDTNFLSCRFYRIHSSCGSIHPLPGFRQCNKSHTMFMQQSAALYTCQKSSNSNFKKLWALCFSVLFFSNCQWWGSNANVFSSCLANSHFLLFLSLFRSRCLLTSKIKHTCNFMYFDLFKKRIMNYVFIADSDQALMLVKACYLKSTVLKKNSVLTAVWIVQNSFTSIVDLNSCWPLCECLFLYVQSEVVSLTKLCGLSQRKIHTWFRHRRRQDRPSNTKKFCEARWEKYSTYTICL